jgi:hypothetical protein
MFFTDIARILSSSMDQFKSCVSSAACVSSFFATYWKIILGVGIPLVIGGVAAYKARRIISKLVATYIWYILGIGAPLLLLVDIVVEHWDQIQAAVSAQLLSPMLTALVGVLGIGLTYRGWRVVYDNNVKLEKQKRDHTIELDRRKAARKLLEDQIEKLYAPLATLCRARQAAMDELLASQGRSGAYFDETQLRPEQLQAWRTWRIEVFVPILLQMQDTILKGAHLLEGGDMPSSFTELMGHVAAYKAIIKEWANVIEKDKANNTNVIDQQRVRGGKFEQVVPHTADQNFSRRFQTEIEKKLKELQAELRAFDRTAVS